MRNKLKILGSLAAVLTAAVGTSFFFPHGQGPSLSYLQQTAVAQEARQDLLIGAERLSDAFRGAAKILRPSVVTVTAKVDRQVQIRRRGSGQIPGLDLPPQFRGLLPDDFFRDFDNEYLQKPQQPDTPMKPSESKPVKMGVGSGVVVSADGYILTNNHVVSKADELEVRLSDNRSFKAKVIGTDENSDLALLKIDASGLKPAVLGDSAKMEVGDWVIAIGSPFELDQTVTAGIISAVNRSTESQILPYEDFLQTDAAINPGNSGGPLVNLRGEVVGINTAINSSTGNNAGVGFAIPSNTASWILNDLREIGRVRRGFVGAVLADVTYEELRSEGLPNDVVDGVRIRAVEEGGPAAKANLKENDIVVKANGREVNSVGAMRNVVAMVRPGDKVEFEIYRQGRNMRLPVVVEEQTADKMAAMAGQATIESLAINVEKLTPEMAEQFDVPKETKGVIVVQIDRRGIGARMGLRPGDVITQVNNKDILNPKDLIKALEGNTSQLMIIVSRGQDEVVLRSGTKSK
jgi:serine protease Do